MHIFVVISVFYYVGFCKALECGFEKMEKEDVRRAIDKCVKNNETLERIFEMSFTSSESNSDNGSQEEDFKTNNNSDRSRKNKRSTPDLSSKFSTRTTTNTSVDNNISMEDRTMTTEATSTDFDDSSIKCTIHCILLNLKLTDESGLPNESSIVEELLKTASGKEVTDFMQDAADECFQIFDKEVGVDPCLYSAKLMTCLGDKIKMNCADWPAGGFPL